MTTDRTGIGQEIEAALGEVVAHVRGEAALPCRIQLVAQGKPRKVAVVAVMRKLLVLANALLGEDRCWLPDRPGRSSAAWAGSAPVVAA